ncbi:InlB B-repeat-containing protein [Rheinheimera salexigens]
MPANNLTLTANWTTNSYTLSFDSAGGSEVAAINAKFASVITAPAAPTREGYAFAGWSPELPIIMPATDVTVTAQWQQKSYTVTATLTGNGAILPATQQIDHGNTAVFALTVLELDTIVNIDGSCGAARSGDNIITAAITAECDVQVSTYPTSAVYGELNTPVSTGSMIEFSINGGAGDKELASASIIRANIETELELEAALALLSKDDNAQYQFTAKRTGHYILMFRDVISGENIPVEITIAPYLAFASSAQPVNTDSTANVKLWLSDEPAYYPVTAKLTSQGAESKKVSLLVTDYRQYVYSVAVNADTEFVLDEVEGALNGTPKRHQLQLQKTPIALAVKAIATQQGYETVVINQEGGDVTLSALVLNADNVNYSWSSESLDISADGYQLTFNPASVSTGVHKVLVNVSEANGQQGQYLLTLQIISHCIENNCYSKNGLPSSVLASEQPQRLPVCPVGDSLRVEQCQLAEQGGYIASSELYQLTLGEWSMAESWDNMQFGAALGKALAEDAGYTHQGVMVNFNITELSVPGESVPVVISLPVGQQIMSDAVWRKYVNGRWQNFVVNASNIIESAATDANKQCPAVSSDVWQSGLTAGHACIRLTLQDGGPNDNDVKTNGVIQDPGVLAVVNATKPLPPETPDEVKPRSSGSIGTLFIVFMSLVLVWRCRVLVSKRLK